jgi:hypothetical protein
MHCLDSADILCLRKRKEYNMPSDIEMSDSDSSILDTEITLDPEIIANIKPAPERVVHKCKKYIRHSGVRAAEAPSVIWRVG